MAYEVRIPELKEVAKAGEHIAEAIERAIVSTANPSDQDGIHIDYYDTEKREWVKISLVDRLADSLREMTDLLTLRIVELPGPEDVAARWDRARAILEIYDGENNA